LIPLLALLKAAEDPAGPAPTITIS